MPTMVEPSGAMNSSGAYVASRAMLSVPLVLMAAGTVAAMLASADWVGMVAVGRATVVVAVALEAVVVELLGLLLQAAATTATAPIVATTAPFRRPRREITCPPPLFITLTCRFIPDRRTRVDPTLAPPPECACHSWSGTARQRRNEPGPGAVVPKGHGKERSMPLAVQFDEYGDVDVLNVVEVARPVPGTSQVVVKVMAAGINPGEAAIRKGLLHAMWPATFPSGQGSDLAGIVAEVGPDVTQFTVGDEVLGFVDTRASHAEFVVVDVDNLVARPPPCLGRLPARCSWWGRPPMPPSGPWALDRGTRWWCRERPAAWAPSPCSWPSTPAPR